MQKTYRGVPALLAALYRGGGVVGKATKPTQTPKPIKPAVSQTLVMKRVILITGTPSVGKTTVAKALAEKLAAEYINLTDYAKANNLIVEEDTARCTTVINEDAMQESLSQTIDNSQNNTIIIDGHYAAAVVVPEQRTHVFVLRRNPVELKQFMEKRGYTGSKIWENLQAEIIDVCLGEAVQYHAGRVCELDATAKTTEQVVDEIVDVLEKRKSCMVGTIDWMGTLEKEGLLDQYLKPE
jgi:Predicted nucleotide kinase (related to CMP and AMP kinases)